MSRVRSRLGEGGFGIIAIAVVNLFLLLCLCVLLNTHRLPRYGLVVRPSESHFIIGAIDRTNVHHITITPGDPPRFYESAIEIKGGISGLEKRLEEWAAGASTPDRVVIIITCDEAVSSGTAQRVADMVLLRGFTCTFSGRPPLGK